MLVILFCNHDTRCYHCNSHISDPFQPKAASVTYALFRPSPASGARKLASYAVSGIVQETRGNIPAGVFLLYGDGTRQISASGEAEQDAYRHSS
jgi:hypothetical protein